MTLVSGARMVAMLLAAAAACAMVPRASAQPTVPNTTASAQSDLEQLSTALNSPSDAATDSRDRDDAARRLVSRQSPEARAILLSAMSSNNPAAQLAVAKAVADDPQPDPALVDRLFEALRISRTVFAARNLPDAAARALVAYNNPDVLRRLIAIVERVPREPEPLRRDILHALGFSTEKRAAQALVTVLRTADEPDAIRKAAAEALTEMTGITDYGADSQRWSDWLANQKGDADFRSEIIARRAVVADQLRQAQAEQATEIHDLLSRLYQAIPPAQQTDFLLSNLRSQVPTMRAQTAQLIEESVALGSRPPDAVRAQLRFMIGDSDSKVRISIVRALMTINDDGALDKMLAQLSQEKNGLVRAELAKALGTINKLEAVPALIEMLNKDPSVVAATAAARAIGDMGERMVKEKSPLVTPAALALREAFDKQRREGGNSDFRETLLQAMVPLKQSDLAATYYRLLPPGVESIPIRRWAIRALGEIGDPKAATVIADAMRDSDSRIRVEAVAAMAKLRNANEHVNGLMQRADKDIEKDISVRDAAWKALRDITPNLNVSDIQNIAALYKDEPERESTVQKTLEEVFTNLKRYEDLAILQQNMGVTLLKLKNYPEAAEYFRKALEYKLTQRTPGSADAIIALRESRMDALLKGKQYDEAIAFAGASIRESSENQVVVARPILSATAQLRSEKDYANAVRLIEITVGPKMDPPLNPIYADRLRTDLEQIKSEMKQTTTPATRPGPP